MLDRMLGMERAFEMVLETLGEPKENDYVMQYKVGVIKGMLNATKQTIDSEICIMSDHFEKEIDVPVFVERGDLNDAN